MNFDGEQDDRNKKMRQLHDMLSDTASDLGLTLGELAMVFGRFSGMHLTLQSADSSDDARPMDLNDFGQAVRQLIEIFKDGVDEGVATTLRMNEKD